MGSFKGGVCGLMRSWGIFSMGVLPLRGNGMLSQIIQIKFPRTYQKLHCKEESYRFRGQREPSVQTDRHNDILLLLYKNIMLMNISIINSFNFTFQKQYNSMIFTKIIDIIFCYFRPDLLISLLLWQTLNPTPWPYSEFLVR